ncbi:hypothetical protein GGR52DRAFT_132234 [Hypoxylon sp. FL1284]|nr:hypothetical protein GGR52DRAFT_132234 [Hypoxylon sp. FL1284]
MGVQQPYLYDPETRDSRSPEKPFDPKAITRASWEPKPKKKRRRDGPLISLNRHPDAYEVPTGRATMFRPMSHSTKSWIKYMRFFQLFLRVFEMIAGAGLLALMILISNVDPLTTWVMRITPGVVAISCTYAIWHFLRPANSRPPASSAAYQFFAGVMDLAVIPLYSFGVISVINHGKEWELIIDSTPQFVEALVLSEYYALICGASMHAVSLGVSIYLGLMFYRIASMPPDMNPLEANLTSRAKYHKRNKSSVATSYTAISDDSKRLSTPLEDYRSSGTPYETLSRPPSIPFMHTRSGSRDSFASSKRDSRTDLPSRQYHITPGNTPRDSPRNSVAQSLADLQRQSTPRLAQRGSYTEVPLHETGVTTPSSLRPNSAAVAPAQHQPINASPTRVAKFTEAWYASESLINRTQERRRAQDAEERRQSQQSQQQRRSQQYEALNARYDFDDDDDDDSDRENMMRPGFSDDDEDDGGAIDVSGQMHPDPLRLHPVPAGKAQLTTRPTSDLIAGRQKTPFEPAAARASVGALSEISLNPRSASGSQDIADEKKAPAPATSFWRRSTIGRRAAGGGGGLRNSSIQADGDFYSKPYGELKSATPPVMGLGAGNSPGGARQVSSGNDYADLGSGTAWRRNVSGKIAEEGLAGKRYSRYSILNDD